MAVKNVINIVIEKMDTTVVIAIADDNSFVSSPVFSAWIRGRLPIGINAIRQRPSIVIELQFMTRSIKNMMIGRSTILSAMYIHILTFFKPFVISDLAMFTPSKVIERNTVALPINVTLFDMMSGGVMLNQNTTRASIAIMVPGLNILPILNFSFPFDNTTIP